MLQAAAVAVNTFIQMEHASAVQVAAVLVPVDFDQPSRLRAAAAH